MKILFVAHTEFELPQYIELWAQEKRFELCCCRPLRGDVLPQPSEFDWLILVGGVQAFSGLENFSFLMDVIHLVEQALAADKIILGFCLGAQIIGEAHGVGTELSPNREVGVFPVELTQEGLRDPLLEGISSTFPAVHWHRYMPGLPETAEVLATSEGCPRQIIRYSSKVYGFQCHPEMTFRDVQRSIGHLEEDVDSGPYIQSKEEFLKSDFTSINRMLISILNNLTALHACG
jgi:GMP synthase (glutamine-hydrolysing)